jgi:hypothetical protein
MRWAIAVLYVATIYLTIPFVPRTWFFLTGSLRLSPSVLSVIFLSAAALIVLTAVLRTSRLAPRSVGGLVLIGAAYYYLLGHAFVEAVERIHLIEYGVLPWLIWRAIGLEVSIERVVVVWVLSANVGVFDELIQHFTPGRYGEIRDVMINWMSCTLGMALVATASGRRSSPGAPAQPRAVAPTAPSAG